MSAQPGSVADPWMTSNEIAEHLKVNPRTVAGWARKGIIPAHSLSGASRNTWRFLRSEVDAVLMGRTGLRRNDEGSQ